MKRRSAPDDVAILSPFPPLPAADPHGRVAVALDDCLLWPERIRLRRGDCWPLNDPLVLAHPASFRQFAPPPLTLREQPC